MKTLKPKSPVASLAARNEVSTSATADAERRRWKPASSTERCHDRCWRLTHLLFQPGLHFRPLRVDHAEVNGIAQPPVPTQHVLSKNAFLDRADAQNRITRLLIQRVRLQLHANASQSFEGMPQHQVLRFGVHHGALPGLSQSTWSRSPRAGSPCRYSCSACTRSRARCSLHRGERQRVAVRLPLQCQPDVIQHFFARSYRASESIATTPDRARPRKARRDDPASGVPAGCAGLPELQVLSEAEPLSNSSTVARSQFVKGVTELRP